MKHFLLIVIIGCIACISRAAEPSASERTPKKYLGKSVGDLTFHDFKDLPIERRNSVVAEIVRAGPLEDFELYVLQNLASEKLLTEPTVLGPLIEVLERNAPKGEASLTPKETLNICKALQILGLLTRRDCGEAVYNGGDLRPETVREVVAWWSQWWAQNHDKHPLIDAKLEATIARHVAATKSRLFADLGDDYPELRGYINPEDVRVDDIEPLVDIQGDTSRSSYRPRRRDADGKWHYRKDDEHTYTRLRVTFKMKKPAATKPTTGSRKELEMAPRGDLAPLLEQVFTEEIPGTDLIITVDAAQKKGDFVRRVRESLSKLQSSPARE